MTRALFLTVVVAVSCSAPRPASPAQPGPAAPPASAGTATTGIDPRQAAQLAPLAPATLTATVEVGRVRLSWPATGEDVAYYQLLRRDPAAAAWTQVGRADPGTLSYLDTNPEPGPQRYGVQAVSPYGLASAVTESHTG